MRQRKHNSPICAFLQFEGVEHLEADVSDVILVFTVSRHFLQDTTDGIVDLLAILEVCAAALKNT